MKINAYEYNMPVEVLEGTATANEMKDEAIKRLQLLGSSLTIINKFKEGKVLKADGYSLYKLCDISNKAIGDVIKKSEGLIVPYAVIVSHSSIGEMYTVLYVSSEKESWKYERPDSDNVCGAYVYNATYPECSEFGSVQIKSMFGGLARIA